MQEFKIASLNCMSCFHNIEDALREFDSNITAKADIRNHTLIVETTQPVEQIAKVIESAGYPIEDFSQK